MTVELRPHQEQQIGRVRAALRRTQSVLMQAPTGCGKTIMAAFMASSAASKRRRVIFLCHRVELIDQTSWSFHEVGIRHAFIANGFPFNPHSPVLIASVGTLQNRLDRIGPPDVLVVDECHHASAKGWARILRWARDGGSKVVGLSATPWRLSGEGLDDHFDEMVQGPSVRWLIDQGYLSDYRIFAPPAPSMQGVHSRGGDFVRSEVEAAVDKPAITGDAVGHYLKHARGTKAVAFCVSIKHSQHVVEQFRERGVSAVHLDGETDKHERRRAIKAFADGHIDVLSNVELFGEGFDLSAQAGREVPIETVIQLRPTQSLSLHLQQVGRGLRPKPVPLTILDHAGNTMRHGLPDQEREWSLKGREKKRGGAGQQADGEPVRQCAKCFHVHPPAPSCPECGYVYEKHERQVEEVDGELEEVDKEAIRKRHEKMARDLHARRAAGSPDTPRELEEIIRYAQRKGIKNPEKWAAFVYTSRAAKNGGKAA